MYEWYLEKVFDNDLSYTYVLNEVREYTFGRKREHDIKSLNPIVSKTHAVIILKPNNTAFIRDVKSTNGTWVNDKKLEPEEDYLLEADDLISFGASVDSEEVTTKEIFKVNYRKLTTLTEQLPHAQVKCFSLKKKESSTTSNIVMNNNKKRRISCDSVLNEVNDLFRGDIIMNSNKNEENNKKTTDYSEMFKNDEPSKTKTIIIPGKSAIQDENINTTLKLKKDKSNKVKTVASSNGISFKNDNEIKQRKMNEEFETNFSFTQNEENDIIEIFSDDERDIFPHSQLFDDSVFVKKEPIDESPDIKNFQDNFFENLKSEIDNFQEIEEPEEDEAELDDEECRVWREKLSQCQDFLSLSQEPDRIKNTDTDIEEEEANEIHEQIKEKEESFLEKDKLEPVSIISLEKTETNLKKVETKESTPARKLAEEKEDSSDEDLFFALKKSNTKDEKTDNKKEKKSYIKPPVIKAPVLKIGKQKASEDDTKNNKDKHRKRSRSVTEETVNTYASSKKYKKITDKPLRDELNKRKKQRQSSEYISKNEKQYIAEERKKRLKEIAVAQQNQKKEHTAPKIQAVKPKVKVSESRGLFLTGNSENKKYKIPKITNNFQSKEAPRSLQKPQNLNNIPKESSKNPPIASIPEHSSPFKIIQESFNIPEITVEPREFPKIFPVCKPKNQRNNQLKSIIKNSESKINKNYLIKKVQFNDKVDIKIFYCERLEVSPEKEVLESSAIESQQNEILLKILSWTPLWLEEQKMIDTIPSVNPRKPMNMLPYFNNASDYFNIVTPLMLMEFWKSIYNDWCNTNCKTRYVGLDNINKKSNIFLELQCHCLIYKHSNDDLPTRGDLLILEIIMKNPNDPSKRMRVQRFGYVTFASKKKITPDFPMNRNLLEETKGLPDSVLVFNIATKIINTEIGKERLLRIRLVSKISPALRLFRSVSSLEFSPLCNFILKPTIQDYKISKTTNLELVITDNLNNDQLMCVYEATEICTRKNPGIYLIHGPPGTGKSFVIKNIVMQLVYGQKRTKNDRGKFRILICAPSNGAIDELVLKLLELRKTYDSNNRFKMIRLGPPNSITHSLVKQISVPELVRKHIESEHVNSIRNNSMLAEQYVFYISRINMFEQKVNSMKDRELDYAAEEIKLKRTKDDFEKFKAQDMSYQERKKQERGLEEYYIKNADIICTTLSSCVHYRIEEFLNAGELHFDCCIIDEATQSTEQENLIPLMLGISKMVLVGDPQQLPPTILCQEAKNLGYGNSLFHRILQNLDHMPENPVRMLKQQYRMHPEICKFSNEKFYANELTSSDYILHRIEGLFHPYRILCLNSTIYQENEYVNKTEANLVLLLANIVMNKTDFNVGIITPYLMQKHYLKETYKYMKKGKQEEHSKPRLVINTVDGFQGQERDVIIISSVRLKTNIFLSDTKRLNVALTRARHAVFICAHHKLFESDSIWKQLEIDAKNRNLFSYLNDVQATQENELTSLICKKLY